MASNYHLQTPYVLASLPRSLDETGCKYSVGEVVGLRPDSKKRRRPELVIGIDGEATNIYDIPAARIITSYPIPPQSSFTCPPCSLRRRHSTSRHVERYTYTSTQSHSRSITLLKDIVESSGTTISSSVSVPVPQTDRVVFLATTSSSRRTAEETSLDFDLLAVKKDGAICCLDAQTLDEKWKTSSDIVSHELPSSKAGLCVEFAQLTSAADVINGIFHGKDDVFGISSQESPALDVVVLVTVITSEQQQTRHLHLLVLTSPSDQSNKPRVTQVHVVPLPARERLSGKQSQYRLDISSGSLIERLGDNLLSYNIAGSLPKVENTMSIPGLTSFIRLSKSSVLTSTSSSFDIYNPLFQSLQATTPLDTSPSNDNLLALDHAVGGGYFVSYFARLELAVAVVNTDLVAVQLEPPKNRSKKRRADGLLIDAIGRGVRDVEPNYESELPLNKDSMFSSYIEGSVSSEYWCRYTAEVQRADGMLVADDMAGFERLLAEKLGMKLDEHKGLPNGTSVNGEKPVVNGQSEHREELPDWKWPKHREAYPSADRRWIMYALGHSFRWDDEQREASPSARRLRCLLPESNVFNYLVVTGHLSISSLKSALKEQLRDVDDADAVLGEQLPELLANIEPTMELLSVWLDTTQLGSIELLSTVRLIMRSLELVRDPEKIPPRLLTYPYGDTQASALESDAEEMEAFGMELDRVEQELQLTEHYLGDDTGTRARAMSIAFGKLGSCPASSVIQNLRQRFSPEETLSLIHILRMELNKDGWTTRYLDKSRLDEDDDLEPPPDGSIQLIADLLCRCIDSVGPGGWLANDAILGAGASEDHIEHLDSADFLGALQVEIGFALQGVQEAVRLRGILTEVVRYGRDIQKHMATTKVSASRELQLGTQAQHVGVGAKDAMLVRNLPLGLKIPTAVASSKKVVSGGEIVKRSRREFGHLKDQKVGLYTLERIAI